MMIYFKNRGFTPHHLSNALSVCAETIEMQNKVSKSTCGISVRGTGFTLIELMVVVVIIGTLAAIAIPNFIAMQDRAKESAVKSNMHTLQLAVEDFRTRSFTVYPANLNTQVYQTNPLYPVGGADYNMCVADNSMPLYGDNAIVGNNLRNPFKSSGGNALLDGTPTAENGAVFYNSINAVNNSCDDYKIYGVGRKGTLPLVLTPGATK